MLVEMMMAGQRDLACFVGGEESIQKLKERLFPTRKMMTEYEAKLFTDDLIIQSQNNWRTITYDKFQACCEGII